MASIIPLSVQSRPGLRYKSHASLAVVHNAVQTSVLQNVLGIDPFKLLHIDKHMLFSRNFDGI